MILFQDTKRRKYVMSSNNNNILTYIVTAGGMKTTHNLHSLQEFFFCKKAHVALFFELFLLSSSIMTTALHDYADTPITAFMPGNKVMEKLQPTGWWKRWEQPMWATHLPYLPN
eukprot:scaffold3823_cov195-Amphora_coffeaeformis.AAC.38